MSMLLIRRNQQISKKRPYTIKEEKSDIVLVKVIIGFILVVLSVVLWRYL